MSHDLPDDLRLVIFDLDGVVYRGPEGIPGAAALVNAVRRRGCAVRFATNNSMATREAYVVRLAGHGIPATPEEIVTSNSATVEHLQAHMPEVRSVLAVGEDGLLEELRHGGYEVTASQDAATSSWKGEPLSVQYDAVVAGLDQHIDYRRIGVAAMAIRSGARFVATNADVRYPVPAGFVPGAGAVVAAIATAAGVEPLVIGKPRPAMFESILEAAGVAATHAVVIGDNPDSDVVAAHRAGIASILVLSGVADARTAATLDGERLPDRTAAGPVEVGRLLGIEIS
jgi:4-nitrophenyl phosphatase